MDTFKTKSKIANMILFGIVGLLSKIFQNDIHSLYLSGSYLNNTFTDGSDIDLVLIVPNHSSKELLNDFRQHINQISPIWIDLKIYDIIEIQTAGFPNLKYSSKLLWGKDIKNEIAELSINEFREKTKNILIEKLRTLKVPQNEENYVKETTKEHINPKILLSCISYACQLYLSEKGIVAYDKEDVFRKFKELEPEWYNFVNFAEDEIKYKTYYSKRLFQKSKNYDTILDKYSLFEASFLKNL